MSKNELQGFLEQLFWNLQQERTNRQELNVKEKFNSVENCLKYVVAANRLLHILEILVDLYKDYENICLFILISSFFFFTQN